MLEHGDHAFRCNRRISQAKNTVEIAMHKGRARFTSSFGEGDVQHVNASDTQYVCREESGNGP